MCCLGSAMWYFGFRRKIIFSWENNIFEAIFPMFFQEENLKTCFAFHFPALETLFLEHPKFGQNDSEIPNLEFENHGFLENQVFLPTEQAGTNIC